MNKVNQREAKLAKQYIKASEFNYDKESVRNLISTAARTMSAAIRSSMKESDKRELKVISIELGLIGHPDFIC
jgi:predicted ArsR family transcriptional regulator